MFPAPREYQQTRSSSIVAGERLAFKMTDSSQLQIS